MSLVANAIIDGLVASGAVELPFMEFFHKINWVDRKIDVSFVEELHEMVMKDECCILHARQIWNN